MSHQSDPKARTKKVCINLAAITRAQYSEVLEVPANLASGRLDALLQQRWDDVDGTEFLPDNDCFDQGDCYHEQEDSDAVPDGKVTVDADGDLVVEMFPVAAPAQTEPLPFSDKWKRFAMKLVVRQHSDKIDPVALFDLIFASEGKALEDIFMEYNVAARGALLDGMGFDDIALLIGDAALRAQETAEATE